MKVELRPWNLDDLMFTLRVRNHPLLMQYFRQDEMLRIQDQEDFIRKDMKDRLYNGNIVLVDGKPAGLCGVKYNQEFTIGILPEYQKKGVATKVMKLMIKDHRGIWSEVFVGNPALEWFIAKLGFKAIGVKERAYYKQDKGLVDVVVIKHD